MKLYTTGQLADKCNYSGDDIIRRMIADGKLKASKFGHVWSIKHRDAIKNRYIKQRLEQNANN